MLIFFVCVALMIATAISLPMKFQKMKPFSLLHLNQKYMSPNNKGLSMSSKSDDSGHQASGAAPQLSPEDTQLVKKLQDHQSKAAKLPIAEDIKTLIENSIGYGVLSTNSIKYPGYPTGSVVGFALDEKGLPFFVFSSMSAHTTDVIKDGKVSLTVTANDFKGAAEGRVVLIGDVKKLPEEKKVSFREKYFARHKDAFWIDFG